MARLLIITALACVLAACDTTAGRAVRGLFSTSKGQPAFSVGIKQYDDGNFADAARNFQLAIDYGLSDDERADAHKHLAFIHCSANRERQCREEFRKALAAQPKLELDAAETGHPVWGPVFRSVKASK